MGRSMGAKCQNVKKTKRDERYSQPIKTKGDKYLLDANYHAPKP